MSKENQREVEKIVAKVKDIIAQYGGMRLTLRQIFYRLVASQVIPNNEKSYKKLGRILVEARKSRKIRYTDIEDRTRGVTAYAGAASNPAAYFRRYYDYLRHLDRYYDMPRWWGQKKKVVVFLEKEALASLFERVCSTKEVDLVVCRGYPSLTLMYEVAQHLGGSSDFEEVFFVYFGDYDPSGADIERHVGDELTETFGLEFSIERKAITREQIEEFDIPPAPAKASDSRTASFVEKEGVAWQVELDAIEPEALKAMVGEAIDAHFDDETYEARKEELERRKELISEWISEAFNEDFEKPSDEEGE
jgi:hypothetical protein